MITDHPISIRRKELGLTLTELAKRSEMPRRTLENWENRVRKPTNFAQLAKLAKVLNCLIEDLIE